MYSTKEVRGLVENYAELREGRETYGYGLHILCLLADLNKAIKMMPPKEHHAILLHGQLRHTVRDAELVLGVARSTLADRYDRGIEWIARYLNTGRTE